MNDQSVELINLGTQNRELITEKYGLLENQELFRESTVLVSELMFESIPELENAQSPQEFGAVLDQFVVIGLKKRFGGVNPEDYGIRAAKAFVERIGTKARDEIMTLLSESGSENPEIKKILEMLPLASSCEQVGSLITDIISSLGFDFQNVFETGKRVKIEEFKAFYERKNHGT